MVCVMGFEDIVELLLYIFVREVYLWERLLFFEEEMELLLNFLLWFLYVVIDRI